MGTYIAHLLKDKKLLPVIGQSKPLVLQARDKIYLRLCRSIMGQQLSTKVAAVIYTRFLGLYNGDEPTALQIAETSPETLRAIGLSNAKATYLLNVARFEIEKGMDAAIIGSMGNEEVIAYLTQIKGVGRWTVEMLLMFTLGREDVFSIGDLAIQQAMIKIYKLERLDPKKCKERLLKISDKWKPYRTYACMHLWQWKDNPPIGE